MARKEMVPVDKPTVPAEYGGYGDVPPAAYLAPQVIAEEPEWLKLRPLHNPDSDLEHYFYLAMFPIRLVCRIILGLTYNVYWFLAIAGTVGLIITLLIAR
jgi:hypothetical protein